MCCNDYRRLTSSGFLLEVQKVDECNAVWQQLEMEAALC